MTFTTLKMDYDNCVKVMVAVVMRKMYVMLNENLT
jgi:hypothetical protein